MKYIKGFFAFWYDFIVGDAWEVAAGVVLSLIALYAIVHLGDANNANSANGAGSYVALLFPVVIIALLSYSLWRVRRSG